MSTIYSDELSARWYVRSVPEQPLTTEHCDEPGVSSHQQGTQENSEVM
jgi:hypothetical protein